MFDAVIPGANEVKLLCFLHEVMVTFEVMINYVRVKLIEHFLWLIENFRHERNNDERLTNMTHLYVMSTTNLFHLEGPFRWNRVKRSRNLSRSCASGHEFRPISNIFQSKRLYRPAITFYLSSNALCYQPFAFIESFNRNERRIYIDRSFEWNNESKREHIGLFR